jgi:hypothetical protein
MDKYAVVLEDPELTKTGSTSKTCPKCGATLDKPQYCNHCGVEPFAKKTREDKDPTNGC